MTPWANLVGELNAIASVMTSVNLPYAICGAVAVADHGAPRSTIDMLIGRGDLTAVLDAIRPLGYPDPAVPFTVDEGTPRERHVQRVSKLVGADHVLVDLLIAEAALDGALDDRLEMHLPDGPLATVSRETLLRMKRHAGRQDALIHRPDEAS